VFDGGMGAASSSSWRPVALLWPEPGVRYDRPAMLSRRRFLQTVSASLLAAPIAVEAQPATRPTRIGFLPIGSPSNPFDRVLVEALRQGLRDVGWSRIATSCSMSSGSAVSLTPLRR